MTYYDIGGKLVATMRLPAMSCCRLDGAVLAEGIILEPLHSRNPVTVIPKGHTAFRRIDSNRQKLDTTFYPECAVPSRVAKEFVRISLPSGAYMQMRIPYLPAPQVAFGTDGSMWCSPSDTYTLYRFAPGHSDTLYRVAKPLKGPLVPDSARKLETMRLARASFEDGTKFDPTSIPRVQPVIESIAVDAVGRVWVRRTDTPATSPSFDVFDSMGRALLTVQSSARWRGIPLLHSGFAYGIISDEDDVQHIVKARLRRR